MVVLFYIGSIKITTNPTVFPAEINWLTSDIVLTIRRAFPEFIGRGFTLSIYSLLIYCMRSCAKLTSCDVKQDRICVLERPTRATMCLLLITQHSQWTCFVIGLLCVFMVHGHGVFYIHNHPRVGKANWQCHSMRGSCHKYVYIFGHPQESPVNDRDNHPKKS